MTFIVTWQGFYQNNAVPFDTREAAKAFADSMVMLKHVKEIDIKEVKQTARKGIIGESP